VEGVKMKRAIFITARVGSSRLPKKHLMQLQGMCCIEHVISRAKRSKYADIIILCTTTLREDDILCDFAEEYKIKYFRGSVEDKLERWRGAVEKYNVDVFATYDADDLLCEPKLIDSAFLQQEQTDADYIQWNDKEMICGCFTYVIKTEALKRICQEKKTNKTEMAFDFFEKSDWCKREFVSLAYVGYLAYERPDIRITLDYIEDYCLFRELFQEFGRNIVNMDLREIVKFIDSKPELLNINSFRHKEWKENQERIIKENKND
jgi:spore coat polysaccharide biosynthesis protein SpsF